MKKVWIKYVLVILLLLPAGDSNASSNSQPSYRQNGATILETSADWGRILLDGGYVLVNNVWNKGATSGTYHQRIFRETMGGKPALGWQWQWPYSSAVVAYPEVVYGDKPWDETLGQVSSLPFKAGSKQVSADFDITLNASGIYNMAFSLWVITDPAIPKKTISHEIMIWNVNHNMTPAGKKEDTITIGGVTFDVYLRKNHSDDSGGNSNIWTYIAFDAREFILKGPLDISAFINYLIDQGILTTEHYITSVELGNEIVRGNGIAEIRDYSITIQNVK